MKRILQTLLSLLLVLLWSTARSQSAYELSANIEVRQSPEKLRITLDSASRHTGVPVHAKYYRHPLGAEEAQRQGQSYHWKIVARGYKIRLYLQLKIHDSDSLYLYNAGGQQVAVYTADERLPKNEVTAAVSETITLRYVARSGKQPPLSISGYSLQLANGGKKDGLDFGDSDFCEINIACTEGDNFRDVEQSVVRINVKLNGFEGWCTGTLINNTAQDFTPYILTAEHCGLASGNFVGPGDLAIWEYYFNYAGENCTNPASESEVNFTQITGSELVARSDDNGGDFGSDFALLRITDTAAFNNLSNPYFAGWDRSGSAPVRGVTIHHPEGDIKKISTFSSPAVSSNFGPTVSDTHWEVVWSPTTTGHGVTEPGSSGCAILNDQGLIKGLLTGGVATCFANTAPDYFGKFSYSWDQNGTANNRKLQPWLDPVGTGNFVMSSAYRGDSIETGPDLAEIEIAPNPLVDGPVLRLWNLGTSSKLDVQVFDISGNLVYSREDITGLPADLGQPELNLQRLKNGLYFVRLALPATYQTEKLIINR